jgi:hypothetical protein
MTTRRYPRIPQRQTGAQPRPVLFPTTDNTWVRCRLSLDGGRLNNTDNTNTLHLQKSLLFPYLRSIAVFKLRG